VAGAVTTVIACSPFVFTKLLNFVGVYGLLLVPAGAIVMTEHWIFPRIGLTRYWASYRNLLVSFPALISWAAAMALALVLWLTGVLHLFYLFLPVYIFTVVLYTILAAFSGARESYAEESAAEEPAPDATPASAGAAAPPEPPAGQRSGALSWISGLLALAALATCLVLPIWVFLAGGEEYDANLGILRNWMIAPTLVYFVAGTIFYVRWRRGRQAAAGSG
jgi:NCS1 family nucleobase:cation symporter-1